MTYKPTQIDRELSSLDPDMVPRRERLHLAWARSSLTPYSRAAAQRRSIALGSLLMAFKEKICQLMEEPAPPRPFWSRPQLTPPSLPPEGSYRPARYFSKGALDSNPKKNPAPIPYLLIETHEISKARPVPGNSLLIRSLCKGKGTLSQNSQGLIYLNVDNRFINAMIPYLKAYGLVRPPYFNLFGSPEGAHIPVISGREATFHYLEKVTEIDREFTFEIEGLYSIEPTLWPEVEQVWFFKVRSPELEKLRRKYFLIEKPGGHSFHIAVAIKPRPTLAKTPHPYPVMRINVAFLAA